MNISGDACKEVFTYIFHCEWEPIKINISCFRLTNVGCCNELKYLIENKVKIISNGAWLTPRIRTYVTSHQTAVCECSFL